MDTKSDIACRHTPRTALVGDFGGTHARLAIADLGSRHPIIDHVRHYLSREFSRAADIIAAYLAETSARPMVAVIAAAGPLDAGTVNFTNRGWSLAESELRGMGFVAARIVNDFVAAALATQVLDQADIHPIGPAKTNKGLNVAVLGPGTGFGASALVIDERGIGVPLAAEAGHASFAPDDDIEIALVRYLMPRLGHVSIEHILSGPGLCTLHGALNALEGVADDVAASPFDAETITQRALAGEHPSLRTAMRFCAIMGGVAGNLALTYGARGGVYIAGGIAPGILPVLEASPFRTRFESKGRFADYLRPVATCVVLRTDAAFLGAAQVARSLFDVPGAATSHS